MSVVWFPGDMWPYESMASIGATFVTVNGCSVAEYFKWLRITFPVRPFSGRQRILGESAVNLKSFLRSIDDTSVLVHQLSWPHLLNAPMLANESHILNPEFRTLRTCEQCSLVRYHSFLHQLPWLSNCFIHRTPLQVSREWNGLRGNISRHRQVEALCHKWFPNRSQLHIGSVKRDRLEFDLPIELRGVLSSLRRLESGLQTGRVGPLAVRCADPAKAVAMALLAPGGKLSTAARCLLLGPQDRPTHVDVPASTVQSRLVLDLDQEQIDDLVEARLADAYVNNLYPPWMLVLEDSFRQMKAGHEPCRSALARLGPSSSLEPPRLHRLASDYASACDVAQDLAKHGVVLCRRPIAIQALAEATDCGNVVRKAIRSYRRIGMLPRMFPGFDSLVECGLVKVTCMASRRPLMNWQSAAECDWVFPTSSTDRDAYDAVVPDGPLAQIADALLLSRLWRWVWALNAHEQRLELANEVGTAATVSAALARLDVGHRFVLAARSGGLRLTLCEAVPPKQPDWCSSESQIKSHWLEVLKRRDEMQASVSD